MAGSIREVLSTIIDDTNNGENPGTVAAHTGCCNKPMYTPTFDPQAYKEKLSFFVLKDIICAMMNDDTTDDDGTDYDGMIDSAIMKHIKDDYNGTCFGYLNCARDRRNSPLFGSVIQEIEEATNIASEKAKQTLELPDEVTDMTAKELLKNVDNYEDLRNKLKKDTSKRVVDEVSKVIQKSSDAPVFDGIDDKMKKKKEDEVDKQLAESFLFRICSSIVTEQALAGHPISTEEGLNRAIIEYCIAEMDYLTKVPCKRTIFAKYSR